MRRKHDLVSAHQQEFLALLSPNKHPKFIVRSEQPFNGGPPLPLLREHIITPTELFFTRNHGTIPDVNAARYRLSVTGNVQQRLELSLADLRAEFPSISLPATLQCAGNRRTELMEVTPIGDELPWDAEAISTGEWRGVSLNAVLDAAGLLAGAEHVAFRGLDEVQRHGATFGYGSSIPLSKARSLDVLLAYELNGAPLPSTHGFPLRVVVPGYIGARSVKWLAEIMVQGTPSSNYFQQHAYKLFPPEVDAATVDWSGGEMLSAMNVNSIICRPEPGATLAAGLISVQGLAITGDPGGIERVEVSGDGGASWSQARFTEPAQLWTWRFWEAQLELRAGQHELVVRAFDARGATQPPAAAPIWNFKGYMNNVWHRVSITVG